MTSYPTLLGTSGHKADSTPEYSGKYYSNIGLGRCPTIQPGVTTESDFSQIIRVPGTISYLSWRVDTGFGAVLTLTLRQNSSNSALAISIGASITGWVTNGGSVDSPSVSVSSEDVVDFVADAGSTPISYDGGFYCVSARFDATTASAQMLTAVGVSPIVPTTTPLFVSFLGIIGSGEGLTGGSETESLQQFQNLSAGTWQNMACNIENNSTTGTTTITNRINGGYGSMSVSVTSSGYLEDTMDSDTICVDDLIDYGFVGASGISGSFKLQWIGAYFVASTASQCMIGGSEGQPTTILGTTPTTENYCSLFGGGAVGPTNPRATGLFPYALEASNFTNYITATDMMDEGAATFTLLKNGGSSGVAVSSTPGETGYIIDNTDVADYAVGDTCANKVIVTSGTGTSVTLANAGLLLQAT